MTICPSCQKSIQIEDRFYGTLFNCPHCRAVFFVGWDGKAEAMVEHEAEPAEIATPEPEPTPEPPAVAQELSDIPAPAETPASTWEAPAAESDQAPVEALSNSDYSYDAPIDGGAIEPEVAAEVQSEPTEYQATGADHAAGGDPVPENDNWSPIGETQPEEKEPTGFADVTEFANSENPAGTLTYTITIRGLELAETFEKLREALTDSRFAWDADAIMGEVRNGEVTLARVNPAKTSILVSRLKYLALDLSWRQDVFA